MSLRRIGRCARPSGRSAARCRTPNSTSRTGRTSAPSSTSTFALLRTANVEVELGADVLPVLLVELGVLHLAADLPDGLAQRPIRRRDIRSGDPDYHRFARFDL